MLTQNSYLFTVLRVNPRLLMIWLLRKVNCCSTAEAGSHDLFWCSELHLQESACEVSEVAGQLAGLGLAADPEVLQRALMPIPDQAYMVCLARLVSIYAGVMLHVNVNGVSVLDMC